MTQTHALAITPAAALPTPAEWQTVVEMARVMVPTGLLPATIKTPEQAVLVMMKGRELRVPPLHALSNIVIVGGKPACSAELMLALVYRDHGDDAVIVEESTPLVCRVSYKRRHWDARRAFAFSIEDARTAGLAGKGTWAQYPQAMLRARAVSAVARLAFPDSLGGMYTPEELGATVTEDGEVASLPATAAPAPATEAPSPRMQALIAEMDAAVADGAATDVVDPRQAFAEADAAGARQGERLAAARLQAVPWTPGGASGVPADDVDSLVGKDLSDACSRMKRAMHARDLPLPPDPEPRTSVEAWRRWWHACAALMAAADAAAAPAR